jgi:aryl-alcohol dehydrogenase-like predicted oxidoreductase
MPQLGDHAPRNGHHPQPSIRLRARRRTEGCSPPRHRNEVASGQGCTASQVSLAWLLAQPAVSSVVVGARTLEQLADNLDAATLELTADERCLLNQASEVPAAYPYRSVMTAMR